MTRTACASRRVLASTRLRPAESVWISDSLLADSFHRFTCTQIRHGSNVPGPLEARRRTSKRRNTSIARLGPGPPIDPNVLFGAGPHNAWWQTSNPSTSKSAIDTVPHFLPSWLVQPARSPPLADNWPIFQHQIVETKVEDTHMSLLKLFRCQLKATNDLEQVRDVIKTLGLNLAQKVVYSELAFDHILTTNYSVASDFLLDPLLNPPSAHNYSRTVVYMTQNMVGSAQRKTLLQAVFKGFSVGLVRREEAHSILQSLPDIMIDSKDGPITVVNTPRVNRYYSIILKCLTGCNVFSTKDLGVDVLNAWIARVQELPCDRYSAKLILALEKLITLSQATKRFEPNSKTFQVFMFRAEVATTSDVAERWLKYLCQHPDEREYSISQLARFLSRLSPTILRSIIIELPNRLAVSVQSNKMSPEALLMWEQVLGSFEKETVAPILRRTSGWTNQVNQADAGIPADARLLLKMWTAFILYKRAEEPLDVFKQMDFPSQLRDQYKENDPTLLWKRILGTLQSLPKLHFRGELFGFLNNMNQPQSAEDVVRTQKDQADLDVFALHGFAVLQDDKAYVHALHSLNDPLKKLAESVNKDITGFARITLPLIARDRFSLRIVTRLLKHNQTLHLALTKSWHRRSGMEREVVQSSNPSANVSQLTAQSTLLEPGDDSHFHEAVLRFMHGLAISFALSPALSDRQALRKVFWCFNFLHRYGAPIRPPITKALWYAGVTRCEGKGTSRRLVVWLLKQIREVEGPATVEGLTRNRDFRAKRAREVWNWGKELGAGRIRDADKAVADDRGLTEDGSVFPGIRKCTDTDTKELAKDIWLSKRQPIRRSESCPVRLSHVRFHPKYSPADHLPGVLHRSAKSMAWPAAADGHPNRGSAANHVDH